MQSNESNPNANHGGNMHDNDQKYGENQGSPNNRTINDFNKMMKSPPGLGIHNSDNQLIKVEDTPLTQVESHQ